MQKKIKIGIAEDHLAVRQGFVSRINEEENMAVVFDVGNGKELLECVKRHSTDIVLLDIQMPEMNGVEALEHLSASYPEVKVIMLTGLSHRGYISECLKRGARAFLPKEVGFEEILRTIEYVQVNGHYHDEKTYKVFESIDDFADRSWDDKFSLDPLSKRETEVLKLLMEDKSNEQIAETLGIDIRTVEGHRGKIMSKTNSKNLAAVVRKMRPKH